MGRNPEALRKKGDLVGARENPCSHVFSVYQPRMFFSPHMYRTALRLQSRPYNLDPESLVTHGTTARRLGTNRRAVWNVVCSSSLTFSCSMECRLFYFFHLLMHLNSGAVHLITACTQPKKTPAG